MATPGANYAIEVTRKGVFDLDTKTDVDLKKVGDNTPVATMQEFLDRMGNNTAAIMTIVNKGLEEYAIQQLADNPDVPWQLVDEDGTLSPFTGTVLSEEKSKSLNATVIQFAKMAFGYAKSMVAGDAEANAAAKKAAKASALAAILSNPAVIEGLKK